MHSQSGSSGPSARSTRKRRAPSASTAAASMRKVQAGASSTGRGGVLRTTSTRVQACPVALTQTVKGTCMARRGGSGKLQAPEAPRASSGWPWGNSCALVDNSCVPCTTI